MVTRTLPSVSELVTSWVSLEELQPHPRNPRHGDVKVIAESLRVNGQYRPIVVSSDDVILAGNHTYRAALSLGWSTIAVVRVPFHSDSAEAARIMVADNRASDLGTYDDAALLELLQELTEETADALSGTGYSDEDLEQLARLVSYESLGQVDAIAEWVDMPEFSSENLPPGEYRCTVRFHTMADADQFFALIGREKRTVVFWPEDWDPAQRQFSGAGKPRVVSDGE